MLIAGGSVEESTSKLIQVIARSEFTRRSPPPAEPASACPYASNFSDFLSALSSAFKDSFKDSCDNTEPALIIQDNLPIVTD